VTPVIAVSDVSLPTTRTWRSTLGAVDALPDAMRGAPVMVLVGETFARATLGVGAIVADREAMLGEPRPPVAGQRRAA
jgi:siroheme synthase